MRVLGALARPFYLETKYGLRRGGVMDFWLEKFMFWEEGYFGCFGCFVHNFDSYCPSFG
jgi:hypothetical protein